VPVREIEADALLASAASRVKYTTDDARRYVLADLARFLGATSRVWTLERRARLEGLLVASGLLSVDPVLASVVEAPREEVVDAAVSVLAGILEKHHGTTAIFEEAVRPPPVGVATSPIVREALLRALVKAQSPDARDSKLRIAYMLAREDVPIVRDVAVQALATIGRSDGAKIVLDLLERLKGNERDTEVLESIDDAIEAVRNR
jgi:hypothetical protein